MVHPVVICNLAAQRSRAAQLAEQLQTQLLINIDPARLSEPELALLLDETGVSLVHTGRKAPGPVRAEFGSGAVNHRRHFGGGKGQMIAKAVGISARFQPSVLDATAGLGRDAFVLASLGCDVTMLERSPLVAALLEDGLARAQLSIDETLQAIVGRMHLVSQPASVYLSEQDSPADVVYLDPMFPPRQKSAQVKKEMRAFHAVVGADDDADHLLTLALEQARYRVVVKRPRKAPALADAQPSYSLEGKTNRFDVYALKKMPT